MKKIYLVILLQIAVYTLFAQRHEPVNLQRPEPVTPMMDKQEYLGYIIRLMPAMPVPGSMNNYGFDILKDNKSVAHQFQNPLPFSPGGIQKKEDAYKIAEWMVREYKNTGHWQNIMPPHIARELKIKTHLSIQKNN